MKAILGMMGIVMFLNANAGERALHAHEHGAIKFGMAIENNIIEIDMDGPAESFLGFEYAPKTEKEKKILSDLKLQWSKNLDLFIGFDKKLGCKVTEASFEQIIENAGDSHSAIEATAKLSCIQKANGSNMTVSLKKMFKNIKKLSIEILGTETKSIKITKPVQIVKI